MNEEIVTEKSFLQIKSIRTSSNAFMMKLKEGDVIIALDGEMVHKSYEELSKELSEIKEKALRTLVLKVDLKDVTSELIDEITALANEYKGKHNLKFILNYQEEDYYLGLRSKKFKVKLEDSFLNHLKQIPELELQIN